MNGLEFVTRKTEKTRNSNDLGGREGKRLKQIEGTFLPQGKLVKGGHFWQGKLVKWGIFPGHQLLSDHHTFKVCLSESNRRPGKA